MKRKHFLLIFFTIFLLADLIGYLNLSSFNSNTSDIEFDQNLANNPFSAQETEQLIMYYFLIESCGSCIDKRDDIIRPFNSSHSIDDFLYFEFRIFGAEETADEHDFAVTYINGSQMSSVAIMVIFETEFGKIVIPSDFITADILEEVFIELTQNPELFQGWNYYPYESENEFNLYIAFINGLLTGINPCIILITIVLGTSIFATQEKKIVSSNMISFIFGLIIGYFILGLLFYYFVGFAHVILGTATLKLLI